MTAIFGRLTNTNCKQFLIFSAVCNNVGTFRFGWEFLIKQNCCNPRIGFGPFLALQPVYSVVPYFYIQNAIPKDISRPEASCYVSAWSRNTLSTQNSWLLANWPQYFLPDPWSLENDWRCRLQNSWAPRMPTNTTLQWYWLSWTYHPSLPRLVCWWTLGITGDQLLYFGALLNNPTGASASWCFLQEAQEDCLGKKQKFAHRFHPIYGPIHTRTAWVSGQGFKGQANFVPFLWLVQKRHLCCKEGGIYLWTLFLCRRSSPHQWHDLEHCCQGFNDSRLVSWISWIQCCKFTVFIDKTNGLLILFSQMPLCSPFPGYLSVLVMDNVQIHHGEGVIALANQFHMCFLLSFFCSFKFMAYTQKSVLGFYRPTHQTWIQSKKLSQRSKHSFNGTICSSQSKMMRWFLIWWR